LKWTPFDQVWAADITYLPMAHGFAYLVAIIDWCSRTVLAWRLSNTLDASFCVDALDEALRRWSPPDIFNTDQGAQFTAQDFIDVLKVHGVRISMDGKGRCRDNIFVERLWRTVKYEEVYLHAYQNLVEGREQLRRYFAFYNNERPHQAHRGLPPAAAYYASLMAPHAVADAARGSVTRGESPSVSVSCRRVATSPLPHKGQHASNHVIL
jgi:putative transposase